MALHLAITAHDDFITQFLQMAHAIPDEIRKLTIVSSPDANKENWEDMELIKQYDYDYVEFANVDWSTVDLYLYNDSLENLKYLTGAAAHSVLSVDMSGYSATLDQMPVIIPRLDETQLEEVQEKHMCSLPHPQVSQLLYVLDHLHRNQKFMYVAVTNLFPVTYLNYMDSAKILAQETREYFNFINGDKDQYYAFNVNPLHELSPQRSINFEAQVRRLAPNVDSVTFHNVVVPVFFGNTQMVTCTLTNGNTLDEGLITDWLGEVKDFEGILYKKDKSSPRVFMGQDEQCLLELSNVQNMEYLKWQSVVDNQLLVIQQTLELIRLFYKENILGA